MNDSPYPMVNTFVIRVWREWSCTDPRWRARIEHLQSQRSAHIQNPDQMLKFIRSFGLFTDDDEKMDLVVNP